jgi:hypothetical protein
VADLQHDDADGEGGFGLHAVVVGQLVVHNVAALGEVPRRALVLVRRVDGVGRSLHVNTVGPEAEESRVQDEREDGEEDFEEPHGRLDQEEEHAYNADYEVVLCVAGAGQ